MLHLQFQKEHENSIRTTQELYVFKNVLTFYSNVREASYLENVKRFRYI
jgi:hypothetical protein